MRKTLLLLIVVLFAVLALDVADTFTDLDFFVGGEEIDGPLGALAALLFAGGGVVVAVVAMLFAGLVLAVTFAGLGLLLAFGLALAALAAAAVLSPLLLPLLLPLAVIWFLVDRARKERIKAQAV